MDGLAGSRMHFAEIILLRSITSLPLFTLGFAPSVMQAYIGFVYVWSSLLHANVGGNFNRLGHWIATPRFHHWHHGLEREAFDVNFAIHLARKSVVKGKSGSVRVDLGGGRIINKKNTQLKTDKRKYNN